MDRKGKADKDWTGPDRRRSERTGLARLTRMGLARTGLARMGLARTRRDLTLTRGVTNE